MEIKIKTQEKLIDATLEVVDGVMIVSPKEIQTDVSVFKTGDVIVCGWNEHGQVCSWVCILRSEIENFGNRFFVEDFCGMYLEHKDDLWVENSDSDAATWVRHATEKEKQKLFDKLAEAGYEWSAEKMELVKLRWKPKIGDVYYHPILSPSINGVEFSSLKEAYTETPFDLDVLKAGWVFKTIIECDEFCEKLNQAIKDVKPN